ncbi:MAG: hypothetical protein IJC50_04450, partial [Clostridia bacterium]|nr:hypothetical protein [Clostridia bacterium]
FFAVIRAVFKDECPLPYHDFDSGDCYLLLAKAYLAVGDEEKAMDAVESSIMYYVAFAEKETDDNCRHQIAIKSPLVKKSELMQGTLDRDIIKKKLLEKLSDKSIQQLSRNARFVELLNVVNNISK